jgi:hypothetical protein
MTVEELKLVYPNISFRVDDEYLAKVLEFAERRGIKENFLDRLNWLGKGAVFGTKSECRLFKDFAPYSFEFMHVVNGKAAMNGGLLYFGPGDTGVDAPQLSVRIGETKEGWEIHT